jgi:hypothetical protein
VITIACEIKLTIGADTSAIVLEAIVAIGLPQMSASGSDMLYADNTCLVVSGVDHVGLGRRQAFNLVHEGIVYMSRFG